MGNVATIQKNETQQRLEVKLRRELGEPVISPPIRRKSRRRFTESGQFALGQTAGQRFHASWVDGARDCSERTLHNCRMARHGTQSRPAHPRNRITAGRKSIRGHRFPSCPQPDLCHPATTQNDLHTAGLRSGRDSNEQRRFAKPDFVSETISPNRFAA